MTVTDPAAALDPGKLYELSGNVLNVVEGIFAAYPSDVVRQPDYFYRSGNPNPTAVPDTVCVSWVRVIHLPPARPDQITPIKAGFVPRSAEITIWVFRGLSDTLAGEAFFTEQSTFQPDNSEADALVLETDAYIVPWGLVSAHAAGQLGSRGSPFSCQVIPLSAQGGIGGTRVDIILELS